MLDTTPKNPGAPKRRTGGGTHTHKPECRCRPCASRRRTAEAVARSAGTRGGTLDAPAESQEPIDADYPVLVTAPQNSQSRKGGQRGRIVEWLGLRANKPTISVPEAAGALGVSPQTLYRDIATATREGWLRFEDPLERIDFQIIPKTLDNLKHFLDEGDKTVTIETAKATIFKAYQEARGMGQDKQTTVLALKLELPEGGELKSVVGKIIGAPRSMTDE